MRVHSTRPGTYYTFHKKLFFLEFSPQVNLCFSDHPSHVYLGNKVVMGKTKVQLEIEGI